MITQPTVFVLGAGASKDYGFPCGDDFRDSILKALLTNRYDYNVWDGLAISPDQRAAVGEAFRKSTQKSIDLFLIRRARHDPDEQRGAKFLEIGKIAIATVILESEVENNLYFQKETPKWYELLWQRMDAIPRELGRQFDHFPSEFGKNQISVVTFNYDRSIEYSLFHHLRATYGIDDDRKVDEMLRQIWFYHVHGLLAYPHFNSDDQNKDNRLPYGAELNAANISRAARNILLVGEQEETMDRLKQDGVWGRLENAEEVVFLGCGYADENLDLLNIQPQWKAKHIGGTFLGMERGEIVAAQAYFERHGKRIYGTEYIYDDVYIFIRKHDFLKPHE